MMELKKRKTLIFILIVAIILGCGFYYFFIRTRVNYLIPGVPYNGIYNLYFQKAGTSVVSSTLNILEYWKDKRWEDKKSSISILKRRFSLDELGTSISTLPLSSPLSFDKSQIINFFTENGYENSGWLAVEPSNVISKIKQYVNFRRKIPVIVTTKRTLDEKNYISLFDFQTVIGIFDDSQKVVVHNFFYGNNYEIPYSEFAKMFQEAGTDLLAVWPSEEIKENIKGPDYNLAYPKRLESMDKAGDLLATKNVLAFYLSEGGLYEQAIATYKEFFNDANFKYLPPAFQILQLLDYAWIYINEFIQPDEAIKVINEQVLPLNKNLSQTLQGWSGIHSDEFATPYYMLSLAYLKKGKSSLAIDAYKKMKSISVSIREKVGGGNFVDFSLVEFPLIEELEKEISSIK